VSNGVEPDYMVVTFIDPSLFVSSETGETIAVGYSITNVLPKLFTNKHVAQVIEATAATVEKVT